MPVERFRQNIEHFQSFENQDLNENVEEEKKEETVINSRVPHGERLRRIEDTVVCMSLEDNRLREYT
jgi:hypothetical protein